MTTFSMTNLSFSASSLNSIASRETDFLGLEHKRKNLKNIPFSLALLYQRLFKEAFRSISHQCTVAIAAPGLSSLASFESPPTSPVECSSSSIASGASSMLFLAACRQSRCVLLLALSFPLISSEIKF
jgi:hypothetical protein